MMYSSGMMRYINNEIKERTMKKHNVECIAEFRKKKKSDVSGMFQDGETFIGYDTILLLAISHGKNGSAIYEVMCCDKNGKKKRCLVSR